MQCTWCKDEMQRTKQITRRNPEIKEGIWSSGLGALHITVTMPSWWRNSSNSLIPCWIKKARDVIALDVCRTRRCRTFITCSTNHRISRRIFSSIVPPRDRCARCLPVICLHVASCYVIMCIASCHHAIMSFLFLTHLNKWHGSLIHLNRGNSHGDSLYNISSRYLESYYKYSINFGITYNTLAY